MQWLNELRKEFPVTERCIYMDVAFDCGGSHVGQKAAEHYFNDWFAAASAGIKGGPGRDPFFEVAAKGKENLSQFLGGVPSRNIAYTKNTNEGINAIVQGFAFSKNANIITAASEHPSVLMPCLQAQAVRGVECRLVNMKKAEIVPWEMIWEAVDERTEMIVLSHVQSSNGYKIDLEALGARCKEKGIFLVVDAIQSLGFSRFYAEKWGVSAVSAGGYKGLGAAISIGFVYCCNELLERITPVYVSGGFGIGIDWSGERPNVCCYRKNDACILENCSADYLGAYVLQATTEMLLQIGLERIENHIDNLFVRLYNGLESFGFKMITPREQVHRCASIICTCDNCDEARYAFAKHNVILSGTSRLRFSIAPYTSTEDIAATLAAAESYCSSKR